ncbi:hypothetical protein CM15mP43_01930 [bacterium]|nr:MAG: hypothetical protein CM15mP43_01930 [bacterium]
MWSRNYLKRGTAKYLRDSGLDVKDVSEVTGFPEMLDGRVKTLHPKIHGGILAIRENPSHIKDTETNNIDLIDLVVVNFYPFEETIKKEGVSFQETIENIDIGGPTIVRAAAKNFQDVSVIVDSEDYDLLISNIKDNEIMVDKNLNYTLAKKAFSYVANYDASISNHLGILKTDNTKNKMPDTLTLHFEKAYDLRYGENPHQDASFLFKKN